jgi:hypothetical protein
LDTDHSGGISREELLFVLEKKQMFLLLKLHRRIKFGNAKNYVEFLFKNLDLNDDGQLQFEEFERILQVEPAFMSIFFKERHRFQNRAIVGKKSNIALLDRSNNDMKCVIQ